MTFNTDLQKFATFLKHEMNAGGLSMSSSVQLGRNGEVGAATKTASALSRAINLTPGAAEAIAANNEVREAFLNAVVKEFGGLDKLPAAVKDALKIKDYGCGKPLTQRRISAVLLAIQESRSDVPKVNNSRQETVKALKEAHGVNKTAVLAEAEAHLEEVDSYVADFPVLSSDRVRDTYMSMYKAGLNNDTRNNVTLRNSPGDYRSWYSSMQVEGCPLKFHMILDKSDEPNRSLERQNLEMFRTDLKAVLDEIGKLDNSGEKFVKLSIALCNLDSSKDSQTDKIARFHDMVEIARNVAQQNQQAGLDEVIKIDDLVNQHNSTIDYPTMEKLLLQLT